MKLDKLTLQQEKQLIEFIQECLKIGLSTNPIKREDKEHREIVDFIYKNYLNLESPMIWYVDSPLMLNLIINILPSILPSLGKNLETDLWKNLEENIRDNLRANLRANIGANLSDKLRANLIASFRENLMDNLGNNLWDNLKDNLKDNLRANLGDNLSDKLRANLEDNLGANLRANLEDNLGANLWANLNNFQNIYWGNADIYWLSFYLFPKNYLGIKYGDSETVALNHMENLCKRIGWIWYFKEICFISDRPIELHKNEQGQLHKDGSPAMLFKDGYCIWYLNGIRVPRYLVETPESALDIEFFKKETNADVRTEFIRKFGIQRMMSLGKKICDSKRHANKWCIDSEYEIWDMGNILDRTYRPYLKMKNLTTGIYHFESISPECRTIDEALRFRSKNRSINLEGVA